MRPKEDNQSVESVPPSLADDVKLLEVEETPELRGEALLDPAQFLQRDTFHLMLDNLPLEDLVASTGVSRLWHTLATQERIWERRFAQHFPGQYADIFAQHFPVPGRYVEIKVPKIFFWKAELRQAYKYELKELRPVQKRLFSYCKEANLDGILRLCPSLEPDDLMSPDVRGFDPLYYAARAGASDILQVLYDRIILPAYETKLIRRTQVYFAVATRQSEDVMATLIATGFCVNTAGRMQMSPLHIACRNGDARLVAQLLLAGAQVNEVNCSTDCCYANAEVWPRLARVPIKELNCKGSTPLHLACANGDEKIVAQLLVAPGVKVNKGDRYGYTPLHIACANGHGKIVSQLLSAPGVKVNQGNRNRDTPLMFACQGGRADIVSQLLSVPGVGVSQANHDGYTPLMIACWGDHADIVFQLLSAPGVEVSQANHDGDTPLMLACRGGHADIVSQLLSVLGVRVNESNRDGYTPLSSACGNGHVKVVSQLLSVPGVEVNKVNRYGHTPLHRACEWRHAEVAAQLLFAGAALHQADHIHRTPLDIIREKEVSFIKTLASVILKDLMRIQLQQNGRYSNRSAQFFGFFGVRIDRLSISEAACVLNEYIQGRAEKRALEKYRFAYRWHPELRMVCDFSLSHPEIIEAKPTPKISDLLKGYFEAQSRGWQAESQEKKLIMICSRETHSLEAYLALALIRMENKDEKEEAESKFEAARLSVRALDPSFIKVEEILSMWLSENVIPSEKIDLLREKLKITPPEKFEMLESSDKGKEEEDDYSPELDR